MNKPIPRNLYQAQQEPQERTPDVPSLNGPVPPWLAEVEERVRTRPTLWDGLTEEDWEFFRNYDGPEVLGPPPPPPMKRRPRRRGEE